MSVSESLAKGLFDELAGIAAGRAGEAFGRDAGFALGGDDDLDGLSCGSSYLDREFDRAVGELLFGDEMALLRASIRHFSTA